MTPISEHQAINSLDHSQSNAKNQDLSQIQESKQTTQNSAINKNVSKETHEVNRIPEETQLSGNKEQRSGSKQDSRFLTPLLMRYGSHLDKDDTQKTYDDSDEKTLRAKLTDQLHSQSVHMLRPAGKHIDIRFLKKYLKENGIPMQKLKNVFDVLRLENKQFKMADSKLRMLLCLLKLLVVKSAFEKKGSFDLVESSSDGKLPNSISFYLTKCVDSSSKIYIQNDYIC